MDILDIYYISGIIMTVSGILFITTAYMTNDLKVLCMGVLWLFTGLGCFVVRIKSKLDKHIQKQKSTSEIQKSR